MEVWTMQTGGMSRKEADLVKGNEGKRHRTAFYRILDLEDVTEGIPDRMTSMRNMKAALEYERVGEMSGDLPKVTQVDGGRRKFGAEFQ